MPDGRRAPSGLADLESWPGEMADRATPRPTLADRLRARIEAEGPITFAAFMEAALYDPRDGFYSRPPAGGGEHFTTSPRTSPAFAMLLAPRLEAVWERLGRPEPFWVLEAGAGDGTLAAQLLELLPAPVRQRTRYVAIERSPAGREAMASLDATVVASVDEAPTGVDGVVLANELLDNVPFHRVRRTEAGLAELYVGVQGDRFALVPGPPSSAEVAGSSPDLRIGQEAVVQPGAAALFERLLGSLAHGHLWLADYGFTSVGDVGTAPLARRASAVPHGYRRHHQEADVLADPGSRDITAGVDFDALADRARRLGHRVRGPITQREALFDLGFGEMDRAARDRQVRAASEGRGLEAARIHGARSRARLLVDPSGLGGFLVLCVEVGRPSRPRGGRMCALVESDGPRTRTARATDGPATGMEGSAHDGDGGVRLAGLGLPGRSDRAADHPVADPQPRQVTGPA